MLQQGTEPEDSHSEAFLSSWLIIHLEKVWVQEALVPQCYISSIRATKNRGLCIMNSDASQKCLGFLYY